MNQIDNYINILYIQEELIQLNEINFKDLLAKVSPEFKAKKLINNIHENINKNKPIKSLKKIKSMLNFLPYVPLKSLDNYIIKKESNFKSLKRTANVVLKNSLPGSSDKALDIASSFLALASMVKKKNLNLSLKDNLKNNIKDFVTRTRKFSNDYEEEKEKSPIPKEDIPDYAIAWVVVVMSTTLAIALGAGLYGLLSTVAAVIPAVLIIGAIIAIIVLMMKDLDSI